MCYGENAEKAAKVCGGNVGRALRYCENKNFIDYYNFALTVVQNYTRSSSYTQKVAYFLKNKQFFEDLLAIMESLFYLALKREIVCDCSEMAIIKCIEAIYRCNQKLKTNANITAVCDELFMAILEEKNRWKM